MNDLMKDLKVYYAIIFKKKQKKEVIARKLFQHKMTFSTGFELMSYKYNSDHLLSDLAVKLYRCSSLSVKMTTNGDNENRIVC